jgi:hypothetical protein
MEFFYELMKFAQNLFEPMKPNKFVMVNIQFHNQIQALVWELNP